MYCLYFAAFRTKWLPNVKRPHSRFWLSHYIKKISSSFPFIPISNGRTSVYTKVANAVRTTTSADVYRKGSTMYEMKREVKNGLCKFMHPDLIAVPKSTQDVSKIVKIARYYNIPISVRSGGHSFICQSIKNVNS